MTANCRDDKDIKKQFMRQNAVDNMLVMKFSFAPIANENCNMQYAPIAICWSHLHLFPNIQVILLPHLWMCSLASYIKELY